jgi:hypothetical protein
MAFWSECPETALVAAGIVGQWEVDAQARTIRLDRAGARYRFDDENLAGVALPMSEIMSATHPDDQDRVFEQLEKIFLTGGSCVFEHRLVLPHLGLRHLQVRGFIGLNDQDVVIGRGVLMDVTPFDELPAQGTRSMPALPRLPYAPLFDPLAEAAAHSIEVREALGQSGHGALRLAADLLLFEINTALAERLTVSDKPVPFRPKLAR